MSSTKKAIKGFKQKKKAALRKLLKVSSKKRKLHQESC